MIGQCIYTYFSKSGGEGKAQRGCRHKVRIPLMGKWVGASF